MLYLIAILSLLASFLMYAITGNELWASVFMCVIALVVTFATLL